MGPLTRTARELRLLAGEGLASWNLSWIRAKIMTQGKWLINSGSMGLEVGKSTALAGICWGCELEGGVVSDLGQVPRGPQVTLRSRMMAEAVTSGGVEWLLMFLWNFSKPLLLFFLPACCPIPHCRDPTDPPGLARKIETRKCAILNTILFSTCLAQLEQFFCPKSFWEFPIPYLLWPVPSQNEEIHFFFFFFNFIWPRICLQCRRPRFDPWVGKSPWRRAWQPTPVFLSGESHGQRRATVQGVSKSQTWLSDSHTQIVD